MTQNRPEFDRREQPLSLRGAMDRLLQNAFVPSLADAHGGQVWPLIDILNTDGAFLVIASLPGVKPDDVELTLENQTLSIRGEIKDEGEADEGEYIYRERRAGRFARRIEFPTRVESDNAEATFEDGSLRLRVPKARETQPQRIAIKPTSRSRE